MKTESELRDWFAGQALSGMHARDSFDPGQSTPEQRAAQCYIDADAMLAARAQSAQPAEPVADSDGWIPWEGGECPVKGETRVEVRFRDSGEQFAMDRANRASCWHWQHLAPNWPGCDITAYRLAREPV